MVLGGEGGQAGCVSFLASGITDSQHRRGGRSLEVKPSRRTFRRASRSCACVGVPAVLELVLVEQKSPCEREKVVENRRSGREHSDFSWISLICGGVL